ncbi:MAG TPA: sulfite exporter TauE/SafE family protein [Thermoleophilia bacterium]|nr:sulfite exporter TauE/SafE family protein [Thermoleophilia bacterium]
MLAIASIGLVAGFLSGLLGIGGGIIVTPLLLYMPQLVGASTLSIRTVAGLTIVQGLLASLVGAISHRRFKFSSGRLAAYMGATIFVAAFLGGAGSKLVSNTVLLVLFLALACAGGILILLPTKNEEEYPAGAALDFNPARAVAVAAGVGLLGGMVGQGGSFILIPLMTWFVKVPTRIAIGSNLAVVLFSSAAGFLGKAFTGQIEWLLAVPLVLTVIPSAALGSRVSRRLSVLTLRRTLAVVIGVAVVRIAVSLLSGEVAG